MYQETITIDIDRLRDDMRDECLGAYFGGGFGAALTFFFDLKQTPYARYVQNTLYLFSNSFHTYNAAIQ